MKQKIIFTPELIQKMTTELKNSQIVKDKVEQARKVLANDPSMQELLKSRNAL